MTAVRSVAIHVFETFEEASVATAHRTQKVVACAVLANPHAGTSAANAQELEDIAQLSFEVGQMLVARCLALFSAEERPNSYAKGAIVGTDGQREHGAAAIHSKLGLAMRQGLRAGTALIPGVEKQGAPGAPIDIVFGGVDTGWEYDAFDSVEIRVPGAPKPDELIIIVGFAVGGRPNARIQGVTPEQVAGLLNHFMAAPDRPLT